MSAKAAAVVLDRLRECDMTILQIADAVGVTEWTAREVVARLLKSGKLKVIGVSTGWKGRGPRPWLYGVPPQHNETPLRDRVLKLETQMAQIRRALKQAI